MKNIKTSVFIATLALWLFGGIACAAELLQCPTELSVKQTIQGAIPEWQSFNSNQKHPYIGVSFSEGPPDQKVILAPDQENKIKGGTLAVWSFPASTAGYWVSCLYAETSAIVAHKLPTDIRSCVVEYDSRYAAPLVKKWYCSSQEKK